jgi:DNA-binding transcriptional LysR family regulator
MPYGIQQPAVSAQMRLLEEGLGARLFERKPFRLTAEGRQLFGYVQPFFEHMESFTARLKKGSAPQVQVGASEMVFREHMPAVYQRLKQLHPQLRVGLRTGRQPQLETWLLDRQIDLAVTLLECRPAPRLRCAPIMSLPLVLLVPKSSGIKSAGELWAQGRVDEPLITLPSFEHFQSHLRRIGVVWPPFIEAGSLDLVLQCVANGYGVGVTGDLPQITHHRKVRVLPLPGFPPMVVACLWLGRPAPLVKEAIAMCHRYAGEHWPQHASGVRFA